MADVPLTPSIFEAARGRTGGWSKEQLAVLGVSWPPKKGWREALTGQLFPEVIVKRFIDLRDRAQMSLF